jgi:hypothetical protein
MTNYVSLRTQRGRHFIPVFKRPTDTEKKVIRVKQAKDICDDLVERTFSFSHDQLKSRCRDRVQVIARQVGMWFLRNETGLALQAIGKHYDRDHATVMHACRTVEKLIMYHMESRDAIEQFVTLAELEGFERCRTLFDRYVSQVPVKKLRVN